MGSLAGWRGKIRFERTSGRFRLGSLVLRINQLCLSVFHRAGGELISFPLNTNFFSGRKPISIKMARAFRILPDYKRLPRRPRYLSPSPSPSPRRRRRRRRRRLPRLRKFALRPPSRSGGALTPSPICRSVGRSVGPSVRPSVRPSARPSLPSPIPLRTPFPLPPRRSVPFFFHARLQSDAVAAASSDSIAESLIPNWSDPNFGAAAPCRIRRARYSVNLVTVYIAFRAANFGISYF